MIKKIIIFSDNRSSPIASNVAEVYELTYFKTAANLRLTYKLRELGYEVLPVHNCLQFTKNDIENIIENFSRGDEVIICASTSFLNNGVVRKNKTLTFTRGGKKNDQGYDEEPFWEESAWSFLVSLGRVAKRKGHVAVLGGWEVDGDLITKRHGGGPKKLDLLGAIYKYLVVGDGIEAITEISKGMKPRKANRYGHINMCGPYTNLDFSDAASTPLPTDLINEGEALSTEIAAGCIFSCSFCNYGALGKKKHEYMRTYESFENEILTNYKNFKTTVYQFTDNICNDNLAKMDWLIKIKDKYGIPLRWVGYLRADTIRTKEHARKIAESGYKGGTFGIESFKTEVGKYIGKSTDINRIKECLHIVRDEIKDDALVHISLIAGLPYETLDDLEKTMEFLGSEEGKYLIDQTVFTTLRVYKDNDTKNEINKARNNPFSQYELKSPDGSNWVSPWGSSDVYQSWAREANSVRLPAFSSKPVGSFNIPFHSNTGFNIDDIVKWTRTNSFPMGEDVYRHMVYERSIAKAREYRKKLLTFVENYSTIQT